MATRSPGTAERYGTLFGNLSGAEHGPGGGALTGHPKTGRDSDRERPLYVRNRRVSTIVRHSFEEFSEYRRLSLLVC
jgi:hypothetical protein